MSWGAQVQVCRTEFAYRLAFAGVLVYACSGQVRLCVAQSGLNDCKGSLREGCRGGWSGSGRIGHVEQ